MTGHATHACDRGMAEAAKGEGEGVKNGPWILATSILASSLAFVDGSVVNVGLPAIGRSLGGSAADLQWVVNAYLLPLSALLLLGGALGDRFGHRRLLVIGVAAFAVASVGCAAAPNLAWLLAARTVQGAASALLLPSSLAILGAAFEGAARGKAIGTWAAMSAISGALGPVLGGWLIDAVGWRSIFLINLPLAAGAIALALLFVPPFRKQGEHAPLDAWGAGLATVALGAFVWGLTLGAGPGGWSLQAIAGVVLGVVLAGVFVAVELKLGDRAMTPPSLFGSPSFLALNLMTLLLYGALGGFMVLVPYLLIQAAHYHATMAGAALIPFTIIMAIGGPFTGGLAGRIGSRGLLTFGALLVAIGLVATLRIDVKAAYWTEVLPSVMIMALGMTCVAAPLTNAVLSSVDGQHTGSASGLNSAVARAGGLIATALLGRAIAAKDKALVTNTHGVALVAAVVCVLAAACAFFGVRGSKPDA